MNVLREFLLVRNDVCWKDGLIDTMTRRRDRPFRLRKGGLWLRGCQLMKPVDEAERLGNGR